MSSNPHSPHLGEVVDATDVVVSGLSARRSRVIVLLLAASVALMMTGFGIIFPIFAKRLGEFGSGVGALGIMTMSFALAQLLVAPLAGAAADRIGRKPIILVALVGFAVANIGFLFASSTWALVAVRAVEGAVTAGLMPATMGVVADIIPEERRAHWVGTVMASLGFGFIFGPVAGGLLYDAWGFEAPFIVSAALGAVAFIAALALVPETRTSHVRRREALEQRREAQAKADRKPSIWESIPTPAYIFAMLLILDFMLSASFAFVEPQMVFYFYDDLGWSPTRFGIVAGAYGSTMVIGQAVVGRTSDKFGRKPIIIIGFILFAGFFFGIAFLRSFPLLIAVAVVAGLGEAMIMPALSAFYLDITSAQHRSAVMGIKSSAASMGGVVGPLALAAVSAVLMPRAIFVSAAIATLVATVAAAIVLREPRRIGDVAAGVEWESSERRSLAAQATLRGVVLNARIARGANESD